jgi:hypothetical protein
MLEKHTERQKRKKAEKLKLKRTNKKEINGRQP